MTTFRKKGVQDYRANNGRGPPLLPDTVHRPSLLLLFPFLFPHSTASVPLFSSHVLSYLLFFSRVALRSYSYSYSYFPIRILIPIPISCPVGYSAEFSF